MSRRNGPRYQRVLALCFFFNRGDTEGTGSTEVLCSMFVYALFYVHLCQDMPFSCTFCMKTMKKAKENWIGEQCSEIEENLRKNNIKRPYQLVTVLTTVKQGKATAV